MELSSQGARSAALDRLLQNVDNGINRCSARVPLASNIGAEYLNLVGEILQSMRQRLCALQSMQSELDEGSLEEFIVATQKLLPAFASLIGPGEHGTSDERISGWAPNRDELGEVVGLSDHLLHQEVKKKNPEPRPRVVPPKAPPRLYVYKLEWLTDRLFPPVTLGPWIDVKDLRRWLDHCDQQHTDHCQLSAKTKPMFPLHPRWLIDVHRSCIVATNGAERYVALSYVWGAEIPFRTVLGSLNRLQREGSLTSDGSLRSGEDPSEGEVLPKTIADVIAVTRLIGERFLWIDSLCIVQDDEQDKRVHLSNMGSIYGNAYVTIVASGGTAFDGLRGIEHVTSPFHREPTVAWHARQSYTLHRKIDELHKRIQGSSWNKRAWTFQEQVFSRRLLIFEEASASWECHCAVWFEGLETLDDQCKDSRKVIAPGLSMSTEPTLKAYAHHLQQYSKRVLTFPEDVLDAFDGVLGALRTAYQGDFICGLPEMFFDAALLWYNDSPLKHRRARRTEGTATPGTWSWAGWEGAVTYGEPLPSPESVVSLVQWKYKPADESQWSIVPQGQYKQGPHRENPEPAADRTVSLQMSRSHLLLARLEKATFHFFESIGSVQVLLKGKSDDCVGMITSCESLSNSEEQRQVYELVAVSKQSFDEQYAYNVLWIGREGDVAHRRGVGRILQSDWEKNDPERIDLVLG